MDSGVSPMVRPQSAPAPSSGSAGPPLQLDQDLDLASSSHHHQVLHPHHHHHHHHHHHPGGGGAASSGTGQGSTSDHEQTEGPWSIQRKTSAPPPPQQQQQTQPQGLPRRASSTMVGDADMRPPSRKPTPQTTTEGGDWPPAPTITRKTSVDRFVATATATSAQVHSHEGGRRSSGEDEFLSTGVGGGWQSSRRSSSEDEHNLHGLAPQARRRLSGDLSSDLPQQLHAGAPGLPPLHPHPHHLGGHSTHHHALHHAGHVTSDAFDHTKHQVPFWRTSQDEDREGGEDHRGGGGGGGGGREDEDKDTASTPSTHRAMPAHDISPDTADYLLRSHLSNLSLNAPSSAVPVPVPVPSLSRQLRAALEQEDQLGAAQAEEEEHPHQHQHQHGHLQGQEDESVDAAALADNPRLRQAYEAFALSSLDTSPELDSATHNAKFRSSLAAVHDSPRSEEELDSLGHIVSAEEDTNNGSTTPRLGPAVTAALRRSASSRSSPQPDSPGARRRPPSTNAVATAAAEEGEHDNDRVLLHHLHVQSAGQPAREEGGNDTELELENAAATSRYFQDADLLAPQDHHSGSPATVPSIGGDTPTYQRRLLGGGFGSASAAAVAAGDDAASIGGDLTSSDAVRRLRLSRSSRHHDDNRNEEYVDDDSEAPPVATTPPATHDDAPGEISMLSPQLNTSLGDMDEISLPAPSYVAPMSPSLRRSTSSRQADDELEADDEASNVPETPISRGLQHRRRHSSGSPFEEETESVMADDESSQRASGPGGGGGSPRHALHKMHVSSNDDDGEEEHGEEEEDLRFARGPRGSNLSGMDEGSKADESALSESDAAAVGMLSPTDSGTLAHEQHRHLLHHLPPLHAQTVVSRSPSPPPQSSHPSPPPQLPLPLPTTATQTGFTTDSDDVLVAPRPFPAVSVMTFQTRGDEVKRSRTPVTPSSTTGVGPFHRPPSRAMSGPHGLERSYSSGARRVRFNPEVVVHHLPLELREDSRKARVGKYLEAPWDDELWDGDLNAFRTRELTPDELRSLKLQRRLSNAINTLAPSNSFLGRALTQPLGRIFGGVDTVGAHAKHMPQQPDGPSEGGGFSGGSFVTTAPLVTASFTGLPPPTPLHQPYYVRKHQMPPQSASSTGSGDGTPGVTPSSAAAGGGAAAPEDKDSVSNLEPIGGGAMAKHVVKNPQLAKLTPDELFQRYVDLHRNSLGLSKKRHQHRMVDVALSTSRRELAEVKGRLAEIRRDLPLLEARIERNANPRLLHYLQFDRAEKVKRLKRERLELLEEKKRNELRVEQLAKVIHENASLGETLRVEIERLVMEEDECVELIDCYVNAMKPFPAVLSKFKEKQDGYNHQILEADVYLNMLQGAARVAGEATDSLGQTLSELGELSAASPSSSSASSSMVGGGLRGVPLSGTARGSIFDSPKKGPVIRKSSSQLMRDLERFKKAVCNAIETLQSAFVDRIQHGALPQPSAVQACRTPRELASLAGQVQTTAIDYFDSLTKAENQTSERAKLLVTALEAVQAEETKERKNLFLKAMSERERASASFAGGGM